MQDYQRYWEFHTFNYKGVDYIFQPFAFGTGGAWSKKSSDGKPTVPAAKKYLQEELNKAYFGDSKTPTLYELFMKSDYKQREKLRVESQTWLSLKIRAIKEKIYIDEGPLENKNNVLVDGGLYFYEYDAEHKDRLPYWDRFPLILLLAHSGKYFWGLNFHYLSPDDRLKFLNKLLTDYKNYDLSTDTLTAETDYYDLKASTNLNEFLPCYKQYFISNIQGRILKLQSHEWIYAVGMNGIADWERGKETKISDIYKQSQKKAESAKKRKKKK